MPGDLVWVWFGGCCPESVVLLVCHTLVSGLRSLLFWMGLW